MTFLNPKFQVFRTYGSGAMENLLKLAQTCFLCVSLIMISNKLSKSKLPSLCDCVTEIRGCGSIFHLIFWFDLRSYLGVVHSLKISSLFHFWFQINGYRTIFWPMGTTQAVISLQCTLLLEIPLLNHSFLIKLLLLYTFAFLFFANLFFDFLYFVFLFFCF